jgi:heme/copper-type cytochrome/quinol oxidase subunit 3
MEVMKSMLNTIAFILGVIMLFVGFFSIFWAAPRKALHPEVALAQIRYLFYGSILLMLAGLVLIILGLIL